MNVFLDTSAFYAIIAKNDQDHRAALKTWADLLEKDTLVTSNYILVETTALLQSRIGLDAVRSLYKEILPAIKVVWIDEPQHQAAVLALSSIGRRRLSLIDLTSFEVIQRLHMDAAFTFDEHFKEQGIQVLPE